jgi:riboflavin transport system permease protein
MSDTILTILVMSAPLLLATFGALASEYAGVLAVFMDGAITLSGFICIAVTQATGSPTAGFAAAAIGSVSLLLAVALFTESTGANPFLAGLAVNLLVSGITSLFSASLFDTRGVVALGEELATRHFPLAFTTFAAFALAALFAFVLKYTPFGLHLRISGSSPETLASRGLSAYRYRILSWCIAAFFAACAGSLLALRLGAFVPNLSAGRGWTALAAVFLGYRKPLLCAIAVIVFTGAEYVTNVIQGAGAVPSTLILGLPYALALIVFILTPGRRFMVKVRKKS